MRRTLAALGAAAVMAIPSVGTPTDALAQQAGLVNIDFEDVTVQDLVDVNANVAANAIVQACDLIDLGEANVLVAQVFARDVTTVTSDCDQEADGTISGLTITQSNQDRGRGDGPPAKP